MEIVYKPINAIRPYFRNARRNSRTIKVLCDIIKRVGFNVPIVVDKKGVIVKGHARYIAAIRLGMSEVPCIVSEASDENNKLDRLADNLVAEFSKWVTDDLLNELRELDIDFDMSELDLPDLSAGIEGEEDSNQEDAPEAVQSSSEGQDEESGKGRRIRGYRVVCPYCGEETIVEA